MQAAAGSVPKRGKETAKITPGGDPWETKFPLKIVGRGDCQTF